MTTVPAKPRVTERRTKTIPSNSVAATPSESYPKYQWQTIITPGHELGFRVRDEAKQNNGRAWAAGLMAATMIIGALISINGNRGTIGQQFQGGQVEQTWLERYFWHDKNTYVKLPGGQAVPYDFKWLANLVPTEQGMSQAQFIDMLHAGIPDVLQHRADFDHYTATFGIHANPPNEKTDVKGYVDVYRLTDDMIPSFTAPQKVFDHADRLKYGIITINQPIQGTMTWGLAIVEGRFTVVKATTMGQCFTIIGKDFKDCPGGGSIRELEVFKPVQQKGAQP